MNTKTAWKVLRKNGDGYHESALVSYGLFCLNYKLNEMTLAPRKDAPIFCFNTRKRAREFKHIHKYFEFEIFKCIGEQSSLKDFGISHIDHVCRLKNFSEYKRLRKKLLSPKGTIYFNWVVLIGKD